ncbi:MAG: heparinase II/III family protein, partial [Pirellula sp.]
ARRSAIIVLRFAEVFPSWCFHYDYPFRQKEVYNGPVDPKNFRSGYRTARWTWWAYSDVPTLLIQAYDDIRDSGALEELSRERGIDAAAIIESNLIREACEQVIANEDQLTNMSPTAWRGLIGAGKTIREPRYVHEPVRRLKRFVETQFFYDGMWSEGSPDYGSQSVGGLEQVLQQLKGYSDPPNYIDSIDGRRFDALDLSNDFVALKLARDALSKMRLPNGRAVPVHDTWPTSQRGSTSKTEPYLLPALGHACLGGGQAEHQTQFHLTWSGGYGHSHGDNLSLMLFADQREQLSDLGYTHTAYRSWTLATSAHNTVVIDGKNQDLGNKESPTDGALQWFDVSNEHVQVVRASGEKGYPGLAQLYSRSLIVIQIDERRYYAVDMFDVMGGDQHDYFLHGDADVNMQIGSSEGFTPIDTLLPSGMKWIPTRNEGETGKIKEPYYAYGFLRDLSSKRLSSDQTEFVTIRPSGESTSGLRLALLTQRDSQLVLGKNPSIRRAAEDDAKLEEYQRPFMMLRQNSASTLSRFVTVVEPFLGTPTIQSIERVQSTEAELAIKVQLQNRVDLIVVRAKTPVEFNAGPSKASFVGELGVLTLVNPNANANTTRGFAIAGRWRHGEYELKSPKPVEAKLMAVDSEGLLVRGINLTVPPPGTVVRIKTLDDWVYPFTLQQSTLLGDGLRLQVREVAAIDFDLAKKRFQLRSFPQREHQGDVMVEWVVPESSRR